MKKVAPYLILSAIYKGVWAIEPQAAQSYLSAFFNAPNAYYDDDDDDYDDPSNPEWFVAYKSDTKTAEINISGAITKNTAACARSAGTAEMAQFFEKSYLDDARFENAVLFIDSGGGMVDGTERLHKAILAANKIKPIYAYVADGVCASAAYWIAAGAEKIIASKTTDLVGSIGVISTYYDYTDYFKAMGIKVHEIVATQSPNKGSLVDEIKEGDYTRYRKKIIDPIAEVFIASIKAARPDVEEAVFTADIYNAQTALDLGLIDAIVERKNLYQFLNLKPNTFEPMNFSNRVRALFNLGEATAKENGLELSKEGTDKLDALLQANEELRAQNAELSAKLEATKAELAQAQATAAEYGAQAAPIAPLKTAANAEETPQTEFNNSPFAYSKTVYEKAMGQSITFSTPSNR